LFVDSLDIFGVGVPGYTAIANQGQWSANFTPVMDDVNRVVFQSQEWIRDHSTPGYTQYCRDNSNQYQGVAYVAGNQAQAMAIQSAVLFVVCSSL
jgi:hypothetical protein